MKLMLLNLLTFLFIATSLVYGTEASEHFIESSGDAFSCLPLLSTSPLSTPRSKMSDKFFTLHVNFFKSRSFQVLKFENLTFVYYLPLYSLLRIKDYFLLI
jgi:hypothetical protein